MKVHSSVLNKVFSYQMLNSLIEFGSDPAYRYAVETYLPKSCKKTNGAAITDLYRFLFKNHRNEYLYKNILFNKLLLGRHSLRTSAAFTEMPIGNSIADFVVINGKAVAYEIKTDLDNFSRLDTQIDDYYRAFDHVCVLCSQRNVDKLLSRYENTPVGIVVLTDRKTLSTHKEPECFKGMISQETLFKTLRKREYERVITECNRELPDAPAVFYFKQCMKVFLNIPEDEAYRACLSVLKERGRAIDVKALASVPRELKLLGYGTNISASQANKLSSVLDQPFSTQKG